MKNKLKEIDENYDGWFKNEDGTDEYMKDNFLSLFDVKGKTDEEIKQYARIVKDLIVKFKIKPSDLKKLLNSKEYQLNIPFLANNIKNCINERCGLELDDEALAKIVCYKIMFFNIDKNDKNKNPGNYKHVIHQMISAEELLAFKNAAEKSEKNFVFDTGGGQTDFSCRQDCSEKMNDVLKELNNTFKKRIFKKDNFKEGIGDNGFVVVEISPIKRIPIDEYEKLDDTGKKEYLEKIAKSREETRITREHEGAVARRKEEIKSFVKNIYDSKLDYFKTLYVPQILDKKDKDYEKFNKDNPEYGKNASKSIYNIFQELQHPFERNTPGQEI